MSANDQLRNEDQENPVHLTKQSREEWSETQQSAVRQPQNGSGSSCGSSGGGSSIGGA